MIGLLVLLMFKHLIFEFILQDSYQYLNRGKYGHPGGMAKAASAAIGSFIVYFLWMGIHRPLSLEDTHECIRLWFLMMIVEGLIHYHLDWGKFQLCRKFGLHASSGDNYYWWIFGTQQMIYNLMYITSACIYLPR